MRVCLRHAFVLQAPRGQATACCKLAVLYHQQGKLEQAVLYFERFYEISRSLGELYPCVFVCIWSQCCWPAVNNHSRTCLQRKKQAGVEQ